MVQNHAVTVTKLSNEYTLLSIIYIQNIASPLLQYVAQYVFYDVDGMHIIYICTCQCIYVCAWCGG